MNYLLWGIVAYVAIAAGFAMWAHGNIQIGFMWPAWLLFGNVQ